MLRNTVFIVYMYEKPPGYPLLVTVVTINLQRLFPPFFPHGLIYSRKNLIVITLRSTVCIVYMYEKLSGHRFRVAVATINLNYLSLLFPQFDS